MNGTRGVVWDTCVDTNANADAVADADVYRQRVSRKLSCASKCINLSYCRYLSLPQPLLVELWKQENPESFQFFSN